MHMIAAVIPACNEETGITQVLDNLTQLSALDCVIPVLNGCTDHTRQIVLEHTLSSRLALIDYPLPLGIDVPRSWGADCAYKLGATAILFVDGDLEGTFSECLEDLLSEVTEKDCDLALTNCYPYIGYRSETAKSVIYYREQLNRKLGLFSSIGLATPSHGPHCISRHLLEVIGTDCLSVPPVMLAKATQAKLNIRVASRLLNQQWTSRQRGDTHNQKIADTIIGDCIAAIQYFQHQPMTREENGIQYLGYRNKPQG